MSHTIEPERTAGPSSFSSDASQVLRALRSSLSGLFGEVGGIRKSRDVQKLFGLDARLSWQVFKIVEPGPPLRIAPNVPSASSLRRLLTAAEKANLSVERIEMVRQAYASFEELVASHAGDRVSFDTMANALCEEDSDSTLSELQHRRAMFKGHSHYFGAQLQTYAVTMMVHPSTEAGRYTIVHLRTKLGQRRLRSDADVIVDMVNIMAIDETAELSGTVFDAEAARQYDAPVIPAFSTDPLPQLHTLRPGDSTMRLTELAGDAIGRRSAIDLTFGQIWRDTRLPASPEGTIGIGGQVAITTPTALINLDVLMHRDTFPALELDSSITSCENSRELPHPRRPSLRLPFREKLTPAGRGVDAMVIRDVPRYGELLDFVCDHLSWNLDAFDVYRLRIEYPILDTLLNFSLHTTETK